MPSGGAAGRPVRVFHVLFALRLGGTEAGVVKLVNAHDRRLVSSAIVSCKPSDSLRTQVADDVPVFEFDRREGNDPRIILQLMRLFRHERPDVVHTHSWGTVCEGLVAAKLARVPFVVHGEHGTMELRPMNRRVQRWAWGRFDRVLSVSSRLAEKMAREVGFDAVRIDVIRNGIDVQRFAPGRRIEARRALGLLSDEIVVGTLGRLVPVKDHANLLAAVARLRTQGRQFTLLIVGDGPLRADLESIVLANGLGDTVRFLGARADADRVLAAMDVYVSSSASEGLSNTIIEAMATGLPVVATHVGGSDELVEDGLTGRLVPAQHADALAAGLAELLNDAELRTRYGAAGRQRAEHEFSLSHMVSGYEAMYRGLGHERRVPAGAEPVEESRPCAGSPGSSTRIRHGRSTPSSFAG